jgi:hypothetical protein
MAGDGEEIFGAPPPKTASSHEIAQSVDGHSVQELDERILALQAELIVCMLCPIRNRRHVGYIGGDECFCLRLSRGWLDDFPANACRWPWPTIHHYPLYPAALVASKIPSRILDAMKDFIR